MESVNMLVSLSLLICVVAAIAASIEEAADDTNGPLKLALDVKSKLESLKEGKSGEETKSFLIEIIDSANVLLKEAEFPEIEPLEVSSEIKVESNETAFRLALKLDGELSLLSNYAERLIKAVGSANSESIVQIIVAIKVKATEVLRFIENSGITYITYQDSDSEEAVVKRGSRRKACLGFEIARLCVGRWVYI